MSIYVPGTQEKDLSKVIMSLQAVIAELTLIEGVWTDFTPTFSSSSGTLTTKSASGRYKQIGKTVFFTIKGVITTNGTGSGWLRFTPPVGGLSTGNWNFDAYNVTDNVLLMSRYLVGLTSATNIDVFKTDGSYPGADGKTYILSGQYESN